MQIGIISDTHDHHHNVRRAIEIFREEGVQCVLHAGDITSVSTVDLFEALPEARLIVAFGNCDVDRRALQTAIEAVGGEAHAGRYEGAIDGRTIRMAHIPDESEVAVSGRACDLVVYGHTHRQDIRRSNGTLIVNPGAARNRTSASSHVVILDTAEMTMSVRSLDR